MGGYSRYRVEKTFQTIPEALSVITCTLFQFSTRAPRHSSIDVFAARDYTEWHPRYADVFTRLCTVPFTSKILYATTDNGFAEVPFDAPSIRAFSDQHANEFIRVECSASIDTRHLGAFAAAFGDEQNVSARLTWNGFDWCGTGESVYNHIFLLINPSLCTRVHSSSGDYTDCEEQPGFIIVCITIDSSLPTPSHHIAPRIADAIGIPLTEDNQYSVS